MTFVTYLGTSATLRLWEGATAHRTFRMHLATRALLARLALQTIAGLEEQRRLETDGAVVVERASGTAASARSSVFSHSSEIGQRHSSRRFVLQIERRDDLQQTSLKPAPRRRGEFTYCLRQHPLGRAGSRRQATLAPCSQ